MSGVSESILDIVRRTVYIHIFFNPNRKVAEDSNIKRTLFEAKEQFEYGVELTSMTDAARKIINKCCDIKYDEQVILKK